MFNHKRYFLNGTYFDCTKFKNSFNVSIANRRGEERVQGVPKRKGKQDRE